MATKAVEKWKSKRWFNVYTPKLFGDTAIGEIPADDEKKLVGRVIKVNMSWITHKAEHSFMVVGLRVSNVNGDAAHTETNYIEQTYSYIHSLVKRHTSVIYTVDSVADKAGKPFVLKLVIITDGKIATPKKGSIRKSITNFAKAYAASHTIEEFMNEVLGNTFQAEAMREIGNIARVNRLEVKKIEL
ncbi:MAG: hypothetical protein KGH72_05475 [Candidatus Micrarchaeota archaeon]|nr:hypothetical protein [Candidatus Micrarchaeota archaeon]